MNPLRACALRGGLALLVAFAVACALGQEEGGGQGGAVFAGLTVTAYGDQEVDILTGITTLPEGGELVDRRRDVTMTARTMRYRENDFIEATGVELAGAFGEAGAQRVRIDLVEGVLEAEGSVTFLREEFGLASETLRYDVEEGVVALGGPVRGSGVDLEAAAAVFDDETGVILLVAPYRYVDGVIELRSDREGSFLSLTPDDDDPTSMVASSRVPPGLMERLEPHLPR